MSHELELNQEYLYVLVFNNPFSKINPKLVKKFKKKIKTDKAETKFRNCFKLSDSDPTYHNAVQELKAHLTGKSEIKIEKLAQKILELVVSLLQKNLGIEFKHSFTLNNKEIIFSLKASETNLKIQAELIDYKLPLKNPESTEPFKKYPPYGDFKGSL